MFHLEIKQRKKSQRKQYCDTMGGIRFCGCVGASQRIPLSVLAWNPHKGLACEITYETGRGRGKKGPRKNRRNQSIDQGSQQKRAGAMACGLRGRVGQRERMSQRSSCLCGNFARIHACTSPQTHRKLRKSVTNFSLLARGANPSLCLFVLFSSTLSVKSGKKCEIPLARDERNH